MRYKSHEKIRWLESSQTLPSANPVLHPSRLPPIPHVFTTRSPGHPIHRIFPDQNIPAGEKPVSKMPALNPCQILLVDDNPIVDDEL
ncbi:MAG: hypothetical protein ABSC61_00855 [Anaerolineales bacterium]